MIVDLRDTLNNSCCRKAARERILRSIDNYVTEVNERSQRICSLKYDGYEMRGCMIWLGLATLIVVFVVGFRVLTSDSRRAIRRLSERLGITPVPLESMIDQLGKTAGNEYLRYLERPNEAHLQNAAQVLLVWQVAIVDGSEQNLHYWYRLMKKSRLAAPITEAQIRLAQGFLRELEPEVSELHALQERYNALFLPEDGVHWLH